VASVASTDFDFKKINDPIHGIIGLSQVEWDIIQTPAFRRLSYLYQLGLSYFVFPGATHTRYAHSIGVMDVMTRMIDAINKHARKKYDKDAINEEEVPKLRLAALLHDIGHYPLGHSSEWVFYRNEDEKERLEFEEPDTQDFMPLADMAVVQKNKSVSHEAFGEFIVTHCCDISDILKNKGYDPKEICSIFTGENPSRSIYSQLVHSTLDADRLDYLLRDSHHAGISYGHIDLDFILTNLKYDKEADLFAIDYKGITTFEHFLISRYYVYHNMTFHKRVMGYELIAKALYHAMAKDGVVIGDYDVLKTKFENNCQSFLADFNDAYFWQNLKQWSPKGSHREYYDKLRRFLISRKRTEVVHEERHLVEASKNADDTFITLRRDLLRDSKYFEELCIKTRVSKECIALQENDIGFEEQPPFTSYKEKTPEEERKSLGRVYEGYKFKDLVEVDFSIIKELSKYRQYIRRLLYYDIYADNPDLESFRESVRKKG
jgi:HD superfamily phosphohydrolase